MVQRKIQLVGNRSYSVSLPKEWVKQNSLKEKNIVEVEITRFNDILITKNTSRKSKLVSLKIEKDTPLVNLIFLCYNRNINELILKSYGFTLEQKRSIKTAIHVLEGYSIIEESSSFVKIIGVSQLLDYSVGKLINRMVYLLKVSCDALESKEKAIIEENEKEINRYYHLCKRILIKCVTDSSLRQLNEIYDSIEIFLWNEILKKIENLGDVLNDMCSVTYSEKTFNLVKRYILSLSEIFNGHVKLEVLSHLVDKNNHLKNRIKSIEGRVHLLCKDLLDNKIELNLNSKYFNN